MGTASDSGSRALFFVAAEPREFSGLLRFCTEIRKLRWPVDWARSARLNGRPVLLAANGAGAASAAAAFHAGCGAARVDGVVSTGFCGAVDPALGIGDIVVATEIEGGGRRFSALVPPASGRCVTGRFASLDHVAQTAEEKQTLRRGGCHAVEMEASALAEESGRRKLPFYCIRSVTDGAEENFINDFNASLRPDGHFDALTLLWGAMCRPRTSLPELWRLRARCQQASASLGEFLAHCRF